MKDKSNKPPSSGDLHPQDPVSAEPLDLPHLDDVEGAMMELFGGSAELSALADEDSNELLRFVESTMTEDESAAFIARVESRDPLAAMRLLRMQEDHRVLRTTGDVVPARDLLGPVRARFARGELVADSNFAAGSVEPTDFMERSVASLARRRRRTGRRIAQVLLASSLVVAVFAVVGWNRDWLGVRGMNAIDPGSTAEAGEKDKESLASFGLVIPVQNFDLAEARIAMRVIEHDAVLIRNREATELGSAGVQPVLIVGILKDAPSDALRTELAERGFQYAVIVDREGVSALMAQLGLVSEQPESMEGPRLVPSGESVIGSTERDAWETWSGRSEAQAAIESGIGPLLVPIALISYQPQSGP